MQLKLERLRLKIETYRSNGEGGEANQAGDIYFVFGGARSPDLPHFIDGKDDPNTYLLRRIGRNRIGKAVSTFQIK